jgi:hypothetical protein
MLPCQKCGYENELGRIFCHQCGTKLDLSQIKAPGQGGKKLKRRGQTNTKKIIRVAIDALILGALAWALYLLIQVPTDTIPKPTDREKIAAESRWQKFEMMTMPTRAGAMDITAAELNAFIETLQTRQAQGQGAVKSESIRTVFGDGVVTIIFRGQVTVAGFEKRLCISYTGIPSVQGGQFEFKPVAGMIGQLPLHPMILEKTPLMKSWFGGMFGGLTDEKRALEKLSNITITPSRATLSYQPSLK